MDNGCIEIGNINTNASTEVIRKLKSILDRLFELRHSLESGNDRNYSPNAHSNV